MKDQDDGAVDTPMPGVDPAEFMKAMLAISPADAERVRDATPATRRRGGQPICGAAPPPTAAKRMTCGLLPGHDGDHAYRTAKVNLTWPAS